MDAIAGLLDGPRARAAFLLRALLVAPWSLHVRDESPLTLIAVTRGNAWITPEGGAPVELTAGDVAVLRGPDHYLIADQSDRPATVVVHPGQQCQTLDGHSVAESMSLGVRTWGNAHPGEAGDAVMLIGAYESQGEVGWRLLAALPTLVIVRHTEWDSPLPALLSAEVTKDAPGQEAVLDRLLDLLVIGVLREWLARNAGDAPAWWRAHDDPVVGPAVQLLHNHPSHPWTVGGVARAVGVSRAALARRFTEVVGEPPMTFLTKWRMTLAADLLTAPEATIGSVARQVGYSTPFALSTAFKRVRGLSPAEHRHSSRRSAVTTAA